MQPIISSLVHQTRQSLIVTLLVIISMLPGQPVYAGQAQGFITVTATVLTECVLGVAALPFGNYDPTSSSPLVNQTSITALCTSAAPYTIALNNGGGTGADATAGSKGRKMTVAAGTATLGYNLYQDSGYSTLWATNTAALSGNGSGILQTYTIYGRVPALQATGAGVYTDTVTATLNF